MYPREEIEVYRWLKSPLQAAGGYRPHPDRDLTFAPSLFFTSEDRDDTHD